MLNGIVHIKANLNSTFARMLFAATGVPEMLVGYCMIEHTLDP